MIRILILDGVDPAFAWHLYHQRAPLCWERGHRPTARHDVGITCDWCGLILDTVDP